MTVGGGWGTLSQLRTSETVDVNPRGELGAVRHGMAAIVCGAAEEDRVGLQLEVYGHTKHQSGFSMQRWHS